MNKVRRAGLAAASFVALIGAWHLLLRSHGAGIPMITDEGEYAVAAKAWSQGGLPYRDAFSQKPPLVFLLYRIPLSFESSSPVAVRRFGTLLSSFTLIALFFVVPQFWSLESRLAAAASFASLGALAIGDYGFTTNTELFVNLFAVFSVFSVLRGSPFVAGLFAGAMLCSKQTSLWSLLAFGAAVVALSPSPARTRRGALFAAGAAAVPAAFALYFAGHGALGDYWRSAWAGNARYAAVVLMTGSFGAQVSWFSTKLLPQFLLAGVPALFLAFVALRRLDAGRARPVETLAVLWLGGAVAGALTGLFLFPHYFLVLAPPLSLLAACGVERMGTGRRAAVVALALWPALLSPMVYFADDARLRASKLLFPNPLFECKVMGETIARRARAGDRLHVFGSEGSLFVYSGLSPATPHTLSYALTLFPESRAPIDEEMARLTAAPPRFLVWSTQSLSTMISSQLGERYRSSLKAFVASNYRLSGRVTVADSAFAPTFESAPATVRPDFETDGQLLLFELMKPL